MSYQKAEEAAKAAYGYILRLGSLTMSMFAVDGWRYSAEVLARQPLQTVIWKDAPSVIAFALCTLAILYMFRVVWRFDHYTLTDVGKAFLYDVLPFTLSSFTAFGYLMDCSRYPMLWWVFIVTIITWLTAIVLRSAFHIAPRMADYKAALHEAAAGLRQIWREHHEKNNDE